jgi:hypothetical protein
MMADHPENREIELLRFEFAAGKKVAAGNIDLLLENESLLAKLESRRVLLEKIRSHLIEKDVLSDFGPELFEIINNRS